MADATLVDRDIREGKKLVKRLDERNYPVFAALWLYRSDAGLWRLVIGTSKVDDVGIRTAYRQLREAATGTRTTLNVPISNISVVGTDDAFLRVLGQIIQTGPKSISEIRFTDNMLNGIYIEDALIYRLSRPHANSHKEATEA